MATVNFAVIDVFSSRPYKGNPLAIVEDLDGTLDDSQMKLITRQFNLSETTFFSGPKKPEATYKLRSFLPDGREVFGIGHNILGVWWFLAQGGFLDFDAASSSRKLSEGKEFTFYQELGDSVMPVKVLRQTDPDGQSSTISISIQQARPRAHAEHPDIEALAESIGLRAEDIGLPGAVNSVKPRVMSTASTYHLLVPLQSTLALDRAVVQRDKILEQLALVDDRAYGLFLFTPDEANARKHSKNAYRARFFSPGMSSEDPATGSAAGPLSVLLHLNEELEVLGNEGTLVVSQGQKIGRECEMLVRLSIGDSQTREGFSVEIIGTGVKVANGSMIVPGPSA